jgi:hypothetical protein
MNANDILKAVSAGEDKDWCGSSTHRFGFFVNASFRFLVL